MTKAKAVLIVAFLVTFAAGAAVGLTVRSVVRRPHDRWIEELNLTPAQRDRMRTIWSEAMHDAGRKVAEQRQALQKERDEAVRALLVDPGQQARYDALIQDSAQKLAALGQEREKLFQEAVKETKEILNPSQRAKYEELLKNRLDRERHRTGGEAPPPGRREEPPPPPSAS